MTTPQMKPEQPDPLTREVIQAFDDLFGVHPGFRPAHSKGILSSGVFTPSAGVATLTAALAFVQAPKPVPTSFAKESFYAVNAYKFTNSAGVSKFGR